MLGSTLRIMSPPRPPSPPSGPPAGMYFAAEAHAAVAAPAGAHADFRNIGKHDFSPPFKNKEGVKPHPRSFFGLLLDGVDRNPLAVSADALVADPAVNLGKQRVVAAYADVEARMDLGTPLTHEDVARQNNLAVGALGAQTLDSLSRPLRVEPTPFYVQKLQTYV